MSITDLPAPDTDTADADRIRFGGGYRLPSLPADTADAGRIAFGGGYRLPADRAAG